jgi:NAD+ synthase (glutamine-hydrolysing)
VKYDEIEIWPMYESFMNALAANFNGLAEDTTEENLQARIRGTLLMALSNKTGKLVLTTGNKSEMTTGYCTLYGDMAGGFAVLKDVAKTLVFALCRWRNTQGKSFRSASSPARLLPSCARTRKTRTACRLRSAGCHHGALCGRKPVGRTNHRRWLCRSRCAQGGTPAEDQRVQAPPGPVGPRVTQRGFGKDWRYPITNKFS